MILKDLPLKFWKTVLLAFSCVFIASGVVLIVVNSVRLSESKSRANRNLMEFSEAGAFTYCEIGIALGLIDAFLGIAGLITVLQLRIYLFYCLAGLLVCTVLGNVLTFYGLGVSHAEDVTSITTDIRKLMRSLYGNNSREDGKKFTQLIDELQSNTPCCGISGDPTENIFASTPWHRQANGNTTKGVERTLPDSCCNSRTADCFSTKNIGEAREAGHVHKLDCVKYLIKTYEVFLVYIFIQISLSTMGQLSLAAILVLFIKYGPREKLEDS